MTDFFLWVVLPIIVAAIVLSIVLIRLLKPSEWQNHPHFKGRDSWCDDADCPWCIARYEHDEQEGKP